MADDNLYAPPSADLAHADNGTFALPVLESSDAIAAFGRAWRLLGDHAAPLLMLTMAVAVPLHAAKALVYPLIPQGTPDFGYRALDLIDALGDGHIIPGAVFLVAEAARSGTRPDLGRSLGWATGRYLPFILLRLVAGLATGLAFCARVIPGAYVAVRLALVDVIVSIRGNPGDALSESWNAVDGQWWRTFGANVLNG